MKRRDLRILAGAVAMTIGLAGCGWINIKGHNQSASTAEQRGAAVSYENGRRVVEVQSGDTLYGLAARHGATANQLIALNGLRRPYAVNVGQKLALPPDQVLHEVQPGDTLTKIARDYGVDLDTLANNNDMYAPYPLRAGELIGVPKDREFVARRAPIRDAGTPDQKQDVQVESLPAPRAQPPSERASAPGTAASAAPPSSAGADAGAGAGVSQAKPAPAPATQTPTASVPKPPKRVPPARSVGKPGAARPTVSAPAVASPGRRGGFLAPIDGPVVAKFGSQADGRRNDGVNIAAPRGAPVRAAADGEVVYAGDALQGYGNLILVRHSDGWVTAYAHLDRILARRGERVARGQSIGAVGSTGGVSAPQLHFEMRKDNKAVDPVGRLSST